EDAVAVVAVDRGVVALGRVVALPGEEQVEVAVGVVVEPGRVGPLPAPEGEGQLGEARGAVVPDDAAARAAAAPAGVREVQGAVGVEIPPDAGAFRQAEQSGVVRILREDAAVPLVNADEAASGSGSVAFHE